MSTDAALRAKPGLSTLSAEGWRQACRITLGSVAGLTIAMAMGWPFGVFFAVYPVLLLGLVPAYNFKIAAQFLGSSLASICMANLLVTLGNLSPVLAIIGFFLFAAFCFGLMARGRWFIFGAISMVSTPILTHLGSYARTPIGDLHTAQFLATLVAVLVAGLMHALLPEHRKMPTQVPAKPAAQIRHQVLLGAICATVSYTAFQSLDLMDSLSAQAATVLVLFPMTLDGGRYASWTRTLGTLLGSAYVLAMQLVLYTHSSNLFLLVLLYAIGLLLFAAMHAREKAGPATGLSAATAIAVLVGQLTPTTDLYGISLYRLSSIAIAILAMLLCISATQVFLNRFESTRFQG